MGRDRRVSALSRRPAPAAGQRRIWRLVAALQPAGRGRLCGKNSFHYRDPRPGAADQRFHVLPWDFNESLGQDWLTERRGVDELTPSDLARYNLIFERLLTEPETRDPLLSRFDQLLDTAWAASELTGMLDDWAAEIARAAARDERRWASEQQDYFGERPNRATHEQEVAFMRRWIAGRHDYLQTRFLRQPLALGPAPAPGESCSVSLPGSSRGALPLWPAVLIVLGSRRLRAALRSASLCSAGASSR